MNGSRAGAEQGKAGGAQGEQWEAEQGLRDDPRLSGRQSQRRQQMITPRCNYRLHLLSQSWSCPKSWAGAFPHLAATDISDSSLSKGFFQANPFFFCCAALGFYPGVVLGMLRCVLTLGRDRDTTVPAQGCPKTWGEPSQLQQHLHNPTLIIQRMSQIQD